MKTNKALSAFEQCALQEDNARLRAALEQCSSIIEDNYEALGYAVLPAAVVNARAALADKSCA